jgi:hypothetical protein
MAVTQRRKLQSAAKGWSLKAIEPQTAKLPSDTFLWAAAGSVAASLALKVMGRKAESTFVAQWVPTMLNLGLYNKLVQVAGSDRTSA